MDGQGEGIAHAGAPEKKPRILFESTNQAARNF
jgi:hypothetical protein